MNELLSTQARSTGASVIKEILQLTKQPEIISFAGGMPNPQTFPARELAQIASDVILNHHHQALQYGPTEGVEMFRSEMLEWLSDFGLNRGLRETAVTTASQQAIDLAGRTLLDPGDVVFCGLPTYLGAVQAFQGLRADCRGIPLEENGMDLETLRSEIREARKEGKQPKFIYVIPDFQNPTGITMCEDKRKQLVRIAEQEGIYVFEDSPYMGLRYHGDHLPPIQTYDQDGYVFTVFSLSKILAAGMRLGLLVGEEEVIGQMVKIKRGVDVCTPPLTQHIAGNWLHQVDIYDHLSRLRGTYVENLESMLEALDKYLPNGEGVTWTSPNGGLFIWVELPKHLDTSELFYRATEEKVAFVPGEHFFVDGSGSHTMRLCFSEGNPKKIDEGIHRLGNLLADCL
ncbi:MAG: PLP-dependent aminotransferase family protein [Candidatus Bipolaricaulota bacterium]